ncbi:MAG: hypothetical protein AAGG07_01140 [Planctomycetota bacterium]
MKYSALIAVAALAGTASADMADLRFVPESSGNTYTATIGGQAVFVGLLGFDRADTGDVITKSFIESRVIPASSAGRLVGIFNGLDTRPWDSAGQLNFASGTASSDNFLGGLSEFSSGTVGADGRIFRGVLIAFTGSSSFSLRELGGGTDTWNGNGTRGDLGELTDPIIPAPTAAAMGLMGLGLVGARRRR